MRADLKAFTDVGEFCIYDPAAVSHLIPGDVDVMKAKDAEIGKGNLLAYTPIDNGEERLRLFVDEPVPADLLCQRRNGVENRLLRLPSGRLVFSGLEDLWTPRPRTTTPQLFASATGEETSMPPGDYAVDAFVIDWGDAADRAVESVKGSADRALDRFVGPLMGCMVFVTVMVLPGILLIAGWAHLWTILKYALIVHALFWPAVWVFYRMSGADSREFRQRAEQILAERPSVVLSLTKLPAETDAASLAGGHIFAEVQ